MDCADVLRMAHKVICDMAFCIDENDPQFVSVLQDAEKAEAAIRAVLDHEPALFSPSAKARTSANTRGLNAEEPSQERQQQKEHSKGDIIT